MNEKATVTIKDWSFRSGSLEGFVYGHYAFHDGTFVTTSYVVGVSKDSDDTFIVETLNTNYILDPPPTPERAEVLRKAFQRV